MDVRDVIADVRDEVGVCPDWLHLVGFEVDCLMESNGHKTQQSLKFNG